MTNIFLFISLVGTFFSNSVALKVVVKNIQVGKGNIVVEVYDNKETFFKKPITSKTVKASSQSLEFSFDLPRGDYAVAVYQDKNENRLLDKGWFNIPKEPYGLSNNFRPGFSAPTFDDCKFKLNQQSTITITLK
ncbi:MAG: DUF2141 domain-containing protein [Ginsengibacter sp.]